MDPMFKSILGAYFFNEPRLLFICVGMSVAILTWRRHPRISATAFAAFSCFVLSFFGKVTTRYTQSINLHQPSPPVELSLVPFAAGLLEFAGWIMVIIAIFMGRPRRSDG